MGVGQELLSSNFFKSSFVGRFSRKFCSFPENDRTYISCDHIVGGAHSTAGNVLKPVVYLTVVLQIPFVLYSLSNERVRLF